MKHARVVGSALKLINYMNIKMNMNLKRNKMSVRYHVSCLMHHLSCLIYRVSCIVSHVSCTDLLAHRRRVSAGVCHGGR